MLFIHFLLEIIGYLKKQHTIMNVLECHYRIIIIIDQHLTVRLIEISYTAMVIGVYCKSITGNARISTLILEVEHIFGSSEFGQSTWLFDERKWVHLALQVTLASVYTSSSCQNSLFIFVRN